MPTLDWAGIARCAEENCAQALALAPDLPPGVSLDTFIRAAADVGPLDPYKHFGANARSIVDRVKAAGGVPAARVFLRAALARTISAGVDSGRYQQLPPLCAQFHAKQLQRIARDVDVAVDWLDLDDDLYQKEFGIASMRLYVAGAGLIDRRCGVERSIVLREGLGKALGKIGLMLRLGGFKPYFQSHLHTFNLDAFNEDGRNDLYRCCAELYSLHPECRGMFAISWFYDPALDSISPRLSYLRKVPLEGGASVMYVRDGGEAINNAIAKSATRRRLYEEGRYVPRNYMLIWGREDQINWARAHPRTPA